MRVIECRGGPRQIGHTTGEELRDEIKEHVALVALPKEANWRTQWQRRMPTIRATLREYLPDALTEMEAMADAANLPVEDIFMANHLHLWGNALDSGDEEGCSNIVFRSGPNGPLWGKNNDGHYRAQPPVEKPACVKKIYPEHGIPMA